MKALDSPVALQSEKRDAFGPHHLLHIQLRGKGPFSQSVGPAINQTIQDLQAPMRHSNLVFIRKCQRHLYTDRIVVFDDTVKLVARILGWISNLEQDGFDLGP